MIHNKDKHPEIFAAKEKAEKELKGLMLTRGLVTAEMADLQLDIEKLEDLKANLNIEAMQDAERITELRSGIKAFAIAMGAKQG